MGGWSTHTPARGLVGLVRGVRAQHPRWNPAKVAAYLGQPRRDVEAVWGDDTALTEYRRHRPG